LTPVENMHYQSVGQNLDKCCCGNLGVNLQYWIWLLHTTNSTVVSFIKL